MGNRVGMFVAGLGLALFFFASCTEQLPEQEYVDWVRNKDNGLRAVKHVKPYVFDLQFQPEDLLWLRARKQGGDFTRPSGTQQYMLTISLEDSNMDFIDFGVSNSVEKQRKEYYFSYKFQDDIYLIENGEKVLCTLFHFEKAVNLKNSRTFVLGFPDGGLAKESTLVIESELINTLPIKVKIVKKYIPQLKFKD